MTQANASTNDLIDQLIALGEHKLAIRVAVCNLKTHIIATRAKQLRRKIAKHKLATELHGLEIDRLADSIPKIIISHQK